MGLQIETMQERNRKLLAHCGRLEKQKAAVMGQMAEMQEKWAQAASKNSRLHSEVATMRQTLEVFLVPLPAETASRAHVGGPTCACRSMEPTLWMCSERALCAAGQHALHAKGWGWHSGPRQPAAAHPSGA